MSAFSSDGRDSMSERGMSSSPSSPMSLALSSSTAGIELGFAVSSCSKLLSLSLSLSNKREVPSFISY